MPLPSQGQVTEFDRETAEAVLRIARLAATHEALGPAPVSRVRNPDGSLQRETTAERDDRVIRAALYHLLEQNLLVFPPDIAETLDDWIPVERVGTG